MHHKVQLHYRSCCLWTYVCQKSPSPWLLANVGYLCIQWEHETHRGHPMHVLACWPEAHMLLPATSHHTWQLPVCIDLIFDRNDDVRCEPSGWFGFRKLAFSDPRWHLTLCEYTARDLQWLARWFTNEFAFYFSDNMKCILDYECTFLPENEKPACCSLSVHSLRIYLTVL